MNVQMRNISQETFGKYQFCTHHAGQWYADDDFMVGGGCGPLKWGSLPQPGSVPRLPWRGWVIHRIRYWRGAFSATGEQR